MDRVARGWFGRRFSASTKFGNVHFLAFVEGFRGGGRLLRRRVTAWYNDMAPERLAYQAAKYQQ